MGSIADKLNYLIETKNRIKAALANKNVAITDETPFREYPDLITSITNETETEVQTWSHGIISSGSGVAFPIGAVLEAPTIIYELEVAE